MFQLGFPVAGQEVRGALAGSVFSGRASIERRERAGDVSCWLSTRSDASLILTAPISQVSSHPTWEVHTSMQMHPPRFTVLNDRNAMRGQWWAKTVNYVHRVGLCHRIQMSPHRVKLPAHQSSQCHFNGLTICSPPQKVSPGSWK